MSCTSFQRAGLPSRQLHYTLLQRMKGSQTTSHWGISVQRPDVVSNMFHKDWQQLQQQLQSDLIKGRVGDAPHFLGDVPSTSHVHNHKVRWSDVMRFQINFPFYTRAKSILTLNVRRTIRKNWDECFLWAVSVRGPQDMQEHAGIYTRSPQCIVVKQKSSTKTFTHVFTRGTAEPQLLDNNS